MNNPQRLEYERRRYVAIRERLVADDPQIDERTLADTVEGLSDFTDVLAAIVSAALQDETEAAVLKVRMGEMADRLKRFEDRAERRRQIVCDEMLEANLKKLTWPEFTVSVRRNPPHMDIIDEKLIPQTFFEMRPHLRKDLLREAMKNGAQVAGAVLSNQEPSLTVRTR